ncbi:MAG: DUF423 domain-containing protein [Flavobacteriales bacterium]|nr:DUF423 domain-containing protein [Flavobacteriales bacterium]
MVQKGIVKAGVLGGVAVVCGAFGAHALKEVLSVEQLQSFNTGVRYQLIHAVVLLVLALFQHHFAVKAFKRAEQFMFWGVLLFSGSIYVLTLKNILGLDFLKFVGPVTPIGGILMIIGWVFVVIGGLRVSRQQ